MTTKTLPSTGLVLRRQ